MCGNRFAPGQSLIYLQGRQIAGHILDALPRCGFVVLVEVEEDRPPGRHVNRAVGGDAWAEEHYVGDIVVGELAVVTPGERGEVRWWFL